MNMHIQKTKGFTLIETLVAITILLVAIAGPMTIAARGLQTSFFAREQVTAQYLAQEGVEYVRWLRDTNELQDRPWLTGLGTCSSTNGCGFSMRDTASVFACTGNNSNCVLRRDTGSLGSARGMYYHGSGGDITSFTRRLWVRQTANREAEVTVQVSWPSNLFGGTRSVTVQSRVFNQYDD